MPEHYATISPAAQPYRVYFGDNLLFETERVLELVEHVGERAFPTVLYFAPPLDGALDLRASDATSRCPLKGEARYFHLGEVADAVWTYPRPYDAVASIAGYFGFDTRKGFRVEPVR